jgi:hypothetical protein
VKRIFLHTPRNDPRTAQRSCGSLSFANGPPTGPLRNSRVLVAKMGLMAEAAGKPAAFVVSAVIAGDDARIWVAEPGVCGG